MSNKSSEPQTPHVTEPAAERPCSGDTSRVKVHGEPVLQMPQDLYIPPDALEVILESFEGPLDLLLYLIRKQNLDILDIPMADITRQYMGYIEMMHELMRLELASEYLLMAAILAEIKSRLLLPRPPAEEGLEEDPRAELVRRLQEYERFKQAAEQLDRQPRLERDTAVAHADSSSRTVTRLPPPLAIDELLLALRQVLDRADLFSHHAIRREALSVRQRMAELLEALQSGQPQRFEHLFQPVEGRLGVVVTLLAVLELARESLIEIVQEAPLSVIHVRIRASASSEETAMAADSHPESRLDTHAD